MAIGEAFHAYLDHFGRTTTVGELHGSGARNAVALRHDVDHDLDVALEMAYWEHDRGCRATYFLLHTAPYWSDDERFFDKVLQIQDFGHEIGLHHNALAQWVRGEVDDVTRTLGAALEHLRSHGVDVRGFSAHGDRACYERSFANYWGLAELRPDDPVSEEKGTSAEGVRVTDPAYQLSYPHDGRLQRDDGASFEFWTVPMASLGVEYEAVKSRYDRYFTDSGGEWKRSPDPLEIDVSRGRHQVLMHPEYWKDDAKRIWFFLSTARSGSRWLAEVMSAATPALVQHEFSLNHDSTSEDRSEKRTGQGFAELAADRDEVRRLLIESRKWIEEQPGDYAEANVYLAHFLPELREVFPDATLVYLHRAPKDVVRSLLNRDWYDTPEDDRHPALAVPGWESLDQFSKVCWYVRTVNEDLLALELPRVALDEVSNDPAKLSEALREVQLPFYPRLAGGVFEAVINAGRVDLVPTWRDWPREWRARFEGILGPVRRPLGYVAPWQRGYFSHLARSVVARLQRARRRREPQIVEHAETIVDVDLRSDDVPVVPVGCQLGRDERGLVLVPDGDRHAYVVLGGGTWQRANPDDGWAPRFGGWFRGALDVDLIDGGTATLYCLQYGESGEQVARRRLAVIRGRGPVRFAFSVRPDASRFSLALQMRQDDLPTELAVGRMLLEAVDRRSSTLEGGDAE